MPMLSLLLFLGATPSQLQWGQLRATRWYGVPEPKNLCAKKIIFQPNFSGLNLSPK